MAKCINIRHESEASCYKYASGARRKQAEYFSTLDRNNAWPSNGRHQNFPQSDLANFSIASRRISA